MSAKVVYRDFGLDEILKRITQTSVVRVRVGVVGPKASEPTSDGRLTHAEAAVINQYGTDDGKIPARDFLRAPFQEKRRLVVQLFKRVAERIVIARQTPEIAVDWVGEQLARIIRDAIMDNDIKPENADTTIARKGFDHPLFETAGLAEAVSHQVVRGSGDLLDAGSAEGDYEGFTATGGDE